MELVEIPHYKPWSFQVLQDGMCGDFQEVVCCLSDVKCVRTMSMAIYDCSMYPSFVDQESVQGNPSRIPFYVCTLLLEVTAREAGDKASTYMCACDSCDGG